MSENDYSELIEQLKEQGCDAAAIAEVLEQVKEYDQQTIRESVFDSIETGGFDLAAIIEQAKKNSESNRDSQ